MSEQNVEGQREPGAVAGSSVSDGQLSQEASNTETVSREELNAVLNELRGLQSKLDKDANAAAKKLESSFEERLKRLGVPLTQEQQMQNRLIELEDQLASVGRGEAKPQTQTVKEPQQPVDIEKIKQAYKDIDFNDGRVLRAVSQNLNDENGLLVALGKIKVENTGKPQPTTASVVSPSGSPTTSANMESLQAEYNRLLVEPFNPENRKARQEIIQRMQELEQRS